MSRVSESYRTPWRSYHPKALRDFPLILLNHWHCNIFGVCIALFESYTPAIWKLPQLHNLGVILSGCNSKLCLLLITLAIAKLLYLLKQKPQLASRIKAVNFSCYSLFLILPLHCSNISRSYLWFAESVHVSHTVAAFNMFKSKRVVPLVFKCSNNLITHPFHLQ